MKHVEYGLKFTLQLENGAFRKGVDSQNGVEEGEICVVLDSLFYAGWLPDITETVIDPLNDLILGNISSMESRYTDPGTEIEFTPSNVILRNGDRILQIIPSGDFRQIIIEWRDFMNEPIEKDWRIRAPFKWFSFFWGDLNCM